METTKDPAGTGTRYERCTGRYEGTLPGALLLCVGGIHGNEYAGILASQRVVQALRQKRPVFRGRFVALAGNLRALGRRQRYVDRDLNRVWLPGQVGVPASAGDAVPQSEELELEELFAELETELQRDTRRSFFMDLHTSSARGAPFLTVGDTLRNREFAMRMPLPLVLGLEEQIDGALLEYINNRGFVTVGVEGGQHDDPASIDHHEAALWLALVATGNMAERDVPELERHRSVLRQATRGVPKVNEVHRRHMVTPVDRFVMKPGFENFSKVKKGDVIAEDRNGPIRATEDCGILLPLYQEQGGDGFFTVTAISLLWLRLSGVLRRFGLPRLAQWLPGVRRHPHQEETLVVDTRVARFLPLQIFRLLGFRKRRWQGNVLLVTRRKYDNDVGATSRVRRRSRPRSIP